MNEIKGSVRLLTAIAFLALVATVAPHAGAGIMRALDTAGLTRAAGDIVVGEVVNRYCRWNASRTRIYTINEVWVREALKGPAAGQLVEVHTIGGELDGKGMGCSLSTRLDKGEEVLLFLRGVGKAKRIVGAGQGKFTILRDGGTGKLWARRNATKLSLYHSPTPGKSAAALRRGRIDTKPLDDLKKEIRTWLGR